MQVAELPKISSTWRIRAPEEIVREMEDVDGTFVTVAKMEGVSVVESPRSKTGDLFAGTSSVECVRFLLTGSFK